MMTGIVLMVLIFALILGLVLGLIYVYLSAWLLTVFNHNHCKSRRNHKTAEDVDKFVGH
jgi:uncharacterized protein (DUF2062 family)